MPADPGAVTFKPLIPIPGRSADFSPQQRPIPTPATQATQLRIGPTFNPFTLFLTLTVSLLTASAAPDSSKTESIPPKSPQESLATITTKPGLRVELVAAEPLIVDPVAIDWGPDGKLWVVEM